MIERNYITPEIKADLAAIDAACIRLHVPPPPSIFLRLEVSDMETGEVELVHEEKANSYVRNWYNVLASGMIGVASDGGGNTFGAGKLPIKDQDGNTRSSAGNCWKVSSSLVNHHGDAARGDVGIAIGTSDQAWSFEDHKLVSQILHGTSAGKMSYAAPSAPSVTYDAGTKKITVVVTKVFSNTSGGSINVNEVGIYAVATLDAANFGMLRERSKLASTVPVANNRKITVTYTFEQSFPA